MSMIVPYRGLASGGVITDVHPFSLPLGAWSAGINVRFRNQNITRAPVFRSVDAALSNFNPRYLASNVPSSGYDTIFIGFLNGRVTGWANGAESDYSVAGYVNATSETCFTSCHLNDYFYINRPDRAPWALAPLGTQFTTIANWAPVSGPWTANILRSCNGALIALGITQNGTAFPTMVITSEFAAGYAQPPTWNYTLGTNNATSNILGQMEGPITDACELSDQLIIYGLNETWRMFLTGDSNIWGYKQLFDDVGAINANCAVEVERKHYVFGLNDIWMHDGNSKISLCDQKTREFIFNGLSVSDANRCAVAYNKNLKEVYFRYVSADYWVTAGGFPIAVAGSPGTGNGGCNRQATYHIPTGTWSFDDLPYVYGAVMANTQTSVTWNSDTRVWNLAGGSWASEYDTYHRVMTMVGDSNTAANLSESLYAFDLQGPGTVANYSIDLNATKGWTLVRDGIDLHELKKDLRGYALVSSIYPQMVLEPGAAPVNFTFGTSDYYGQPTQVLGTQTYDGNTLYKLDFNATGRYVSMTIQHPDYHYVNFTGIDFDLDVLAEF